MATMFHTPGPWRAERDGNGDYRIVYNETGNWLAKVYADGESEVAKADAALIATAPELLDALIAADLLLRDLGCSLPQVKAAIAKATAGGAV